MRRTDDTCPDCGSPSFSETCMGSPPPIDINWRICNQCGLRRRQQLYRNDQGDIVRSPVAQPGKAAERQEEGGGACCGHMRISCMCDGEPAKEGG